MLKQLNGMKKYLEENKMTDELTFEHYITAFNAINARNPDDIAESWDGAYSEGYPEYSAISDDGKVRISIQKGGSWHSYQPERSCLQQSLPSVDFPRRFVRCKTTGR